MDSPGAVDVTGIQFTSNDGVVRVPQKYAFTGYASSRRYAVRKGRAGAEIKTGAVELKMVCHNERPS
jgi:hypothetical protein